MGQKFISCRSRTPLPPPILLPYLVLPRVWGVWARRVGRRAGGARFTMQAPPARNAAIVVEFGADGEVCHVPASEEVSKTEHEFYIICAALSVRSMPAC